ncbi:phosphoribosyl transferase domain protein [Penicillium angulare]|uniref:Phosphoribosyl transferase domain protein n=1 Tax=Penicillium angulare TaxID=116970 RepID=A0A9W9FAK7_9EURO|nr:phosphoribosyl transferase domain protein [Penicillium angulare]
MKTVKSLKQALLQAEMQAEMPPRALKKQLSDEQYQSCFRDLMKGSESITYRDFIIPRLSELIEPFTRSYDSISVLEIGPGPESILGHLPNHHRSKIGKYVAFEPNKLFAACLKDWLCNGEGGLSPFPNWLCRPIVHQAKFAPSAEGISATSNSDQTSEKFHIVLFCHSMYRMQPKAEFIRRAVQFLVDLPEKGMVIVFHRDEQWDLAGLFCHEQATYPTGTISVKNCDEDLNKFSSFIVGFTWQDNDERHRMQSQWQQICRKLGHREMLPNQLVFSSPAMLATFSQLSVSYSSPPPGVPSWTVQRPLKNREVRGIKPPLVFRPTTIEHVAQCVRWAIKNGFSATVIGGGHSGHCVRPNVVAIDMGEFNEVHITSDWTLENSHESGSLIIAGAGCKAGEVISEARVKGLTVPLGSRPSVGAGLWLQGGIGNLTRLHGLACDAIVGAVMVSVDSGQILFVGNVPSRYRPAGATRSQNEEDLLWAIKGAGSNFGIIVSVIFRGFLVPTYFVKKWIISMEDGKEAISKLDGYAKQFTEELPRSLSASLYLYLEAEHLSLGVTIIETLTNNGKSENSCSDKIGAILGPTVSIETVDSLQIFDIEMYMSTIGGGHKKGKTSSFKRCVFLRKFHTSAACEALVSGVQNRPTPLCYVHLVQGGGAVQDLAPSATAFGCRGWTYACVITGVWPREADQTELPQAVIEWTYRVTAALLPFSDGVYSADLGPDPRDTMLALRSFGSNLPRLAYLKHKFDPLNLLAHTCPIQKPWTGPRLIILVSGHSCAGKDYCADVWKAVLAADNASTISIRKVSISDKTKKDYALACGANWRRLVEDRVYKEQHRADLTKFFEFQVWRRPQLPEEHFLEAVKDSVNVDVLIITGMRDRSLLPTLSPLVPGSRLLDIRVTRSKDDPFDTRAASERTPRCAESVHAKETSIHSCPSLVFENDLRGISKARQFAQDSIRPLLSQDLLKLAAMIPSVSNFPHFGIDFQHVLHISQCPEGLSLCTSLMEAQFAGSWSQVHSIICCEVGSLVFASSLASSVKIPLVLIRQAGKLPPPVVSVKKPKSHISSCDLEESRLEMDPRLVSSNAPVVIVDDVLATGKTLCATIELLRKAHVPTENISVIVIAEFPIHRGREMLHQREYGDIRVQSLLYFEGA